MGVDPPVNLPVLFRAHRQLNTVPPGGTSSLPPIIRHPMIKKHSASGNSLGLIIGDPILELPGITEDPPLEIETDGEPRRIGPMKLSKKDRIRESTKRMMAVHDETLRRLAK